MKVTRIGFIFLGVKVMSRLTLDCRNYSLYFLSRNTNRRNTVETFSGDTNKKFLVKEI